MAIITDYSQGVPLPRQPLSSPTSSPKPEPSSASTLEWGEYVSRKVRLLSACYRRDDANDPEMYATALAAVLADYPRAVVDYVTDPRTGLPRRLKWLPSIAEVVEACNERMPPSKPAAQAVATTHGRMVQNLLAGLARKLGGGNERVG